MKSIVNDTESQSATHSQVFIDQPELLRRLGICRKTAWTWERQGKLPVVKIFHTKRYHWASVEAALLRQQRGGCQ
jgi:predicted site-specific integrase-resolvase